MSNLREKLDDVASNHLWADKGSGNVIMWEDYLDALIKVFREHLEEKDIMEDEVESLLS